MNIEIENKNDFCVSTSAPNVVPVKSETFSIAIIQTFSHSKYHSVMLIVKSVANDDAVPSKAMCTNNATTSQR